MQTKQQQRAEFALNELRNKIETNAVSKDLANFIVGMPNMILSNGLGQSLVFLKSKSSKMERDFVFKILKKYIILENSDIFSDSDDLKFLSKLNSISVMRYLKIQDECLRMLEWLKRYARAFQNEDSKGKTGD